LQGERGYSGVAVEANGLYAFNVDDNGDLILSYTGGTAPNITVNESGDLIWTW
jgi:hypothetical protein